jgi:hypothetical protein
MDPTNDQQDPDIYGLKKPEENMPPSYVNKASDKPVYKRNPNHGHVHHFFSWLKFRHSHLSKKKKIMVAVALFVIIVGGLTASYLIYKHYHQPTPSTIALKSPLTAVTIPSRLTGLPVTQTQYSLPVTGVMIENSPDARPQSGLGSAGVVFEAVAEGGITRFLALYEEEQPSSIGPVRSVRPYYLDWLLPFDASVAHVGGSPQALSQITSLHVKDLNQFYNGQYFQRISSRAAPHNVYTNMTELSALDKSKGFTSSNFTGFARKKAAPVAKPTAASINLNLNGAEYNVSYAYATATNSYNRSEGGAPHIDQATGAQISPKVVIALVMARSLDPDGDHTDYGTVGSGAMYVFQDGTVQQGTWSKASDQDQFSFKTGSGTTLKLNPGQTWITMVDGPSSVTYSP